ncbi:MAG: acylphosphatase [Opitutaceae bacterium]|nr:acylphosphatase [Opitutaceae bacterium]
MHAIAPRTTKSGDAASHSRERHGSRSRHHGSEHSTEMKTTPFVATEDHPATKPARSRHPRIQELEGLDEGDIVLHVHGAGLSSPFCEFVCHIAVKLGLRGWARCEAGAVTLRAVGREPELAALVHELCEHTPPDASIRSIDPDTGDGGAALPEHGFVMITGDFSTASPPAEPPMPGVIPDW